MFEIDRVLLGPTYCPSVGPCLWRYSFSSDDKINNYSTCVTSLVFNSNSNYDRPVHSFTSLRHERYENTAKSKEYNKHIDRSSYL